MGLLTGTGILLCMVAVLFVLPAMLAWHEDHHERRQRIPRHYLHSFGSDRLIGLCFRHPVPVLVIGLIVTAVAGVSASRLEFVDSIQAMRPKGNESVAIRDEIATRFGAGFEQMMWIVEVETADEVLGLAEAAAGSAAELVERGVLTGHDSISSLLPSSERQQKRPRLARGGACGSPRRGQDPHHLCGCTHGTGPPGGAVRAGAGAVR